VVTAGLLGGSQPWSVWPGVAASANPEDVLAEVEAAQLRGRGGAGFRAAAKWRAALEHPAPRVVVAIRAIGRPGKGHRQDTFGSFAQPAVERALQFAADNEHGDEAAKQPQGRRADGQHQHEMAGNAGLAHGGASR